MWARRWSKVAHSTFWWYHTRPRAMRKDGGHPSPRTREMPSVISKDLRSLKAALFEELRAAFDFASGGETKRPACADLLVYFFLDSFSAFSVFSAFFSFLASFTSAAGAAAGFLDSAFFAIRRVFFIVSTTIRPRYVPQFPQTRCIKCSLLHFSQTVNRASFKAW